MLYDKPSDIFEQQISEIFSNEEDSASSLMMKLTSIILFQNENSHDLVEIYKEFGLEKFTRLMEILDGRTVQFFTKEQIHQALILATCYYYKEIENKSWNEIHDIFPFKVSGISYGTQIKSLNMSLIEKLKEIGLQLQEKKDA